MIPTSLLLEGFIAALAEASGPPTPGPPDHFVFDPHDFSVEVGDEQIVLVTAVDADGVWVDSYSGPVDIYPAGQANSPNDYGWSGGVLTLGVSGFDAGGAGLTVVDRDTGTPSGVLSFDVIYPP